jgi:hypothetical protein
MWWLRVREPLEVAKDSLRRALDREQTLQAENRMLKKHKAQLDKYELVYPKLRTAAQAVVENTSQRYAGGYISTGEAIDNLAAALLKE